MITALSNKLSKTSSDNSKVQASFNELNKKFKALQLRSNARKPFSADLMAKLIFIQVCRVSKFLMLYMVLRSRMLPNWLTGEAKKCPIYQSTLIKSHQLSSKHQFFLVLMRLRLGLLNQDLAERFQISEANCTNKFATWIRFLGKFLGDAIITWLPKDVIHPNIPSVFEGDHQKTNCIIDCKEVYIERPKSLLYAQACTWSDYNKHNPMNFLVAIAPSGYIMFLSDCYGGRATDQYICQDSGFYNLLEYGHQIMADCGFQIKEDLLYYYSVADWQGC